jgi:RNA polymerase sigma-70 factor (ECF subfamily)
MLSGKNSSPTSLSLIERVRHFDPQAWQRLCDIYGPLVYGWARRAGLQDEDARDIGQEVFRTVAMRIGDFRKQTAQDTFRGWLRTITRHKLGDYLRRTREEPIALGGSRGAALVAQVPILLEEDDPVAANNEASGVLHRGLETIRAEFEPTTWQAFWRATVEGQSSEVIATDLGISCGAVRQAKYRVLRRLRHDLRDL